MPIWTGQYNRTMDEKGRFLLPKHCREALVDPKIYLAPGTHHCLEIHTESSLNARAQRLEQSSGSEQATRAFIRLFYSQSQQIPLDAQGRLRIPNSLISWADLDREIVIVGAGNCLEIWNADRWMAFLNQYQSDFDQLCESAFSKQPANMDSQPTSHVQEEPSRPPK